MSSPLVISSPGKSTLPVLDRATVSRPTFSCSRVVVLALFLRNLPDHLGRAIVPAEPLEPGVAQPPVRGPFTEADLRDEAGPGPVHPALAGQVTGLERAAVLLHLAELGVQQVQRPLVEPGPHLARVDQPPLTVVVPEQQGAEAGAAALRVGEPADDQLLVVLALELQPVLGPAGLVGGAGPLGDEPLPAQAAGLGVEPDAVADPVLGEAQRVAEVQQLLQPLVTLAQWLRAQVGAVGPQHVEDVVLDRHGAQLIRGRVGLLHPLLQLGEAGLAVVERDHLAVHHEIAGLLGTQCLDELGIGAADRLLVAGHQPNLVAVAEGQAPLAVQLALIDPGRVGEPVLGQRGQLRLEPARLAVASGHRGPSPPVTVADPLSPLRAAHPPSVPYRPADPAPGAAGAGPWVWDRRAPALASPGRCGPEGLASPVAGDARLAVMDDAAMLTIGQLADRTGL